MGSGPAYRFQRGYAGLARMFRPHLFMHPCLTRHRHLGVAYRVSSR